MHMGLRPRRVQRMLERTGDVDFACGGRRWEGARRRARYDDVGISGTTARRGQNVSWRDEANNRCARAAQCAWSVRLNSLGMGQDKSPEDAPSVPSSCAGLAGTWSFRQPRAATPPRLLSLAVTGHQTHAMGM